MNVAARSADITSAGRARGENGRHNDRRRRRRRERGEEEKKKAKTNG
jgi:hypothetical protein